MTGQDTRDVDWALVEGALARAPSTQLEPLGRLGRLLLGVQRLPRSASLQELSLQSLQLLKSTLQLERIGLFLRTRNGLWLHGVVGTDENGRLVDERGIRYQYHPDDERLQEDLRAGRRGWLVYEDAPLVSHGAEQSEVLRRGWLAKTAVISSGRNLGIAFSDAAFSGESYCYETQELIATFFLLVGDLLDEAEARRGGVAYQGASAPVQDAIEVLHADPSLSQTELAKRLGIGGRRLSRLLKEELGVTLVDYRNQLRLERFFQLLDRAEEEHQAPELLPLALQSGFGSYAQFHRIFSAQTGKSPTKYLRPGTSRKSHTS